MMSEYPTHPAAEMFPAMTDAEFDDLVADIRQHGLREPVVLYDGSILDGRHRFRACRHIGIEPSIVEWDGPGRPEDFVISKNLHRRHLSESQRAMVAGRLRNMRQGERTDLQPPANLQEVSTAEAAEKLNVGERNVRYAGVVLREGTPEEIKAVETGEAAVSTTAKAIRGRRDRPAAESPKSLPGPRIQVPFGETPESICRRGMAIEKDGRPSEAAAEAIGVGKQTYVKMRDIVMLSDRDDLSEQDRESVDKALFLMNETGQASSAYELVESISTRIWGETGSRRGVPRDRAESNRLEKFRHQVGQIIQVCSFADNIDIPHIGSNEAKTILSDLAASEKQLRQLRSRITEIAE